MFVFICLCVCVYVSDWLFFYVRVSKYVRVCCSFFPACVRIFLYVSLRSSVS